VAFEEFRLAGPGAAALNVMANVLELSLPADSAGGEFSLFFPGSWQLNDTPKGVKLNPRTVPGGHGLELAKRLCRQT
jgi:hypothetical protein